MQNQITNQLLLFGIQPAEYQITTHPTGEIEITVAGNAVAVIPTIGRKVIQLNRGWTLDRIPGDSLILAVSAVVAALLRCRHTGDTVLPDALPTLSLSMVENTSPPCGGEVAIPRLRRWLSNIYDHRRFDAPQHYVYPGISPREEEWRDHLRWINENVVGPPKPTAYKTEDQLRQIGMIGIYTPLQ